MKNNFIQVRGVQCDRNGETVNNAEELTFAINVDLIKAIEGHFVYLKEPSNIFHLTDDIYYCSMNTTENLFG